MKSSFVFLSLWAVVTAAGAQSPDRCEDCELLFEGMPATLNASAQLAGPDEPGEKLLIEGTIYQPDGKTPAPDIILYVYHTDASGRYSPGPTQTQARRHGHLRGWVKSDAKGRYSISTIRPASYPKTRNPQHIHPIVVESRSRYYWIDDYLFTDDPLLTAQEKAHQPGRGGSGIITLRREGGVWKGQRDIILGRSIPDYTTVKK